MNKYRTTGHDIAAPTKPPLPVKIGEPPPGKLGIYKADGSRVGHIGPKAGAGAVSRFIGHTNVAVTQVNGRPAWKEIGPTSGNGAAKAAAAANAKVEKSLRTARGSIRKTA